MSDVRHAHTLSGAMFRCSRIGHIRVAEMFTFFTDRHNMNYYTTGSTQ